MRRRAGFQLTITVLAALGAAGFTSFQNNTHAAAAPPASDAITIRIVDQNGQGVANAELGNLAGVRNQPDAEQPPLFGLSFYGEQRGESIRTDENGQATIPAAMLFYRGSSRPTNLTAQSEDGALLAFRQLTRDDVGRTIELVLQPTCRVEARVTSEGLEALGRARTWTNIYVKQDNTRLFGIGSTTGVHVFRLPAGEYALYTYGTDTDSTQPKITIEPGERKRVVEIDLMPSRLAELIGHPAPEFTQIKGWKNGGPVSLKELRGKVVLLDFWGYWCGPCIGAMPELIELHDKYKDHGLVIVAVHDDSVETIEEMQERIAKNIDTRWRGRDLPFLIALDGGGATRIPGRNRTSRGATTAVYGINSFPTQILIDRDGIVVDNFRRIREEGLRKMLGLDGAMSNGE